ncbi:MAG: energy transducer TonB [Rhodocyclaceae bacterium]|nr:energy transducer TonB [Rhodocyclaceae bacterium]
MVSLIKHFHVATFTAALLLGISTTVAADNTPLTTNPAPDYPKVSRALGEQGRVVLKVFVNKSGEASQVSLDQSSGYPRLDEAALAAVQKWRFVPAQRNGALVAAWVYVPLVFTIEKGAPPEQISAP